MEEEAESASCGAGAGDLLAGYCFLNDFVEVWTGFGVVVVGESGLGGVYERREGNENKEKSLLWHCHAANYSFSREEGGLVVVWRRFLAAK